MPPNIYIPSRRARTRHPAQDRWDDEARRLDAAERAAGRPGFDGFDLDYADEIADSWRQAFSANRADYRDMREDIGFYFGREVEAVQSYVAIKKEPRFKAANGDLFPIDTFGGKYATSIKQREFEGIGEARIGGHAATEAPFIEAIAQEESRPVVPIDAAYGWNLKDIWIGEHTGEPLERYKAEIVKKAMFRKLDNVIANGHTTLGGGGVINHAGVPDVTLGNGNWVDGEANADQIIDDINQLKTEASDDTGGEANLTDVGLPPRYETYLLKRLGDNTVSVKTYIEEQCGVRIHSWYALKDAGASGEDILFAWEADPTVIKVALPVPFMQLPPQAKSRAWIVECLMETAGLIVDQPLFTRRAALTSS